MIYKNFVLDRNVLFEKTYQNGYLIECSKLLYSKGIYVYIPGNKYESDLPFESSVSIITKDNIKRILKIYSKEMLVEFFKKLIKDKDLRTIYDYIKKETDEIINLNFQDEIQLYDKDGNYREYSITGASRTASVKFINCGNLSKSL